MDDDPSTLAWVAAAAAAADLPPPASLAPAHLFSDGAIALACARAAFGDEPVQLALDRALSARRHDVPDGDARAGGIAPAARWRALRSLWAARELEEEALDVAALQVREGGDVGRAANAVVWTRATT